jgi:hypothetical protein
LSPVDSVTHLRGSKKIRNISERLSIGLSFAPGSAENNLDLDALAEYNKSLLPDNLIAVREQ